MNLGVIGTTGENMVAAFLRKNGYDVIKRNYQCRFGEIDIIAKNNRLLLFVEVKTRAENAVVSGMQAVDKAKQQKIILTAEDYLSKQFYETNLQPRFDVAEVTVHNNADGNASYSLNYIANAF